MPEVVKESIVYICAGSNLGDRIGFIQQASCLLKDTEGIELLDTSSFYETEPFGYKNQEWFVNAILKIKTALEPYDLLKACRRVESQLGRERYPEQPKWGPRKIDLDILFYDDKVVSTDVLQIPHAGVHLRAFALVPMLELAPDLVHPTIGKSMLEIHSELPDPEEVYLYGTRPIYD